MTKAGKIAEGSLLTTDDQLRLYREAVGAAAVERQIRETRKRKGLCICPGGGRKVKFDWNRTGKKTQRVLHEPWCPRRKPWMSDAEELLRAARSATESFTSS